MIHRPRGHARTRCLVWSRQSPLEFFQYGSGRPCALIALSLQPEEVGNDNREVIAVAMATAAQAMPMKDLIFIILVLLYFSCDDAAATAEQRNERAPAPHSITSL